MSHFATLILILFSFSSAAERWADSVPQSQPGSRYDIGGLQTRPQLTSFEETDIQQCKKYAGKPLPANRQRRLYRHMFLSKLHENSLSILENVHGDNLGYEDCMAGGVARGENSILGNCEFKKKEMENSPELYRRWRGSMYIAGLSFPRAEMQGGKDGLWGGEKAAPFKSSLHFGSDLSPLGKDEMTEIQQRIDQGKKRIATMMMAETQFANGKCYRQEGVDLVRTDFYYEYSGCYLRDGAVREKAHRLFEAEANRQMAEDTAKIATRDPWVAYMSGDPKTASANSGIDKMNSEIEKGREQIKAMKPGDLQADQRMSLAASKRLLNSTIEKALESPAKDDIPDGVSPELHRQFLCSAAQEIVDDVKSAKSAKEAGLLVLGASGGVACITSGLLPCIIAGSATALTADTIKLKSLYADQANNTRAFLSGHRGVDEFNEAAKEIEDETFMTYAFMPSGVVVPVALHGAFKLVPAAKAAAAAH